MNLPAVDLARRCRQLRRMRRLGEGLGMLLEACLNGRSVDEHPRIPRTPQEIAADALASVDAGAAVVHFHCYDDDGVETFASEHCAAAIRAVRSACPQVPISLTTSEGIEPHPQRLHSIEQWTELPDLVTGNQGEDGIAELCALLISRGVGIEAGLLEIRDARLFVESGLAKTCTRVLVEPLDEDPAAAVAEAETMERVLHAAGIQLEQIHHGDGLATWHIMERGLRRGYGTRAGLEDTIYFPDGSVAPDNASLVRLAAELMQRAR